MPPRLNQLETTGPSAWKLMASRASSITTADRGAPATSMSMRNFAAMLQEILWLNAAFPEAMYRITSTHLLAERRHASGTRDETMGTVLRSCPPRACRWCRDANRRRTQPLKPAYGEGRSLGKKGTTQLSPGYVTAEFGKDRRRWSHIQGTELDQSVCRFSSRHRR